jgi:hypothetical protein
MRFPCVTRVSRADKASDHEAARGVGHQSTAHSFESKDLV